MNRRLERIKELERQSAIFRKTLDRRFAPDPLESFLVSRSMAGDSHALRDYLLSNVVVTEAKQKILILLAEGGDYESSIDAIFLKEPRVIATALHLLLEWIKENGQSVLQSNKRSKLISDRIWELRKITQDPELLKLIERVAPSLNLSIPGNEDLE